MSQSHTESFGKPTNECVANRRLKDQKVKKNSLVWVRRETTQSGMCKKTKCPMERSLSGSGSVAKWWYVCDEGPIYRPNVTASGGEG